MIAKVSRLNGARFTSRRIFCVQDKVAKSGEAGLDAIDEGV